MIKILFGHVMKINKSWVLLLFVFLSLRFYSQNVVELDLQLKEKKLPFGLTKKVHQKKPITSLVLSGGGARAISHLGVLKAIDESNISIEHIVGTSMGSIMGGLYAAGYSLDQMHDLMNTIGWEELFFITGEDRTNLFVDQKITEDRALFSIRLNGLSPVIPQSINTGNKIANFLTNITLNAPLNQIKSFDDLLFKYRVVTTELIAGNKYVIEKGSLSEAMRASSSVSFLLPPIYLDSLMLVDGGLVENLPIKSAEELNPDIIIASDATSALKKRDELIYPWDIADQIVSIPSRKVWEDNIKNADVLVRPSIEKRKNDDFKNLDAVVLAGYNATKKRISEIKRIVKNKFLENLSEDNQIFNNLFFNETPNEIEKYLSNKYSGQEFVAKSQILYDLYSFYDSGEYKNISASITNDSVSKIVVKYEYNPLVQSIQFDGVSLIPIEDASNEYSSIIGKAYNANTILESTLNLLRLYRSLGYLSVSVDSIIFTEKGELKINVIEAEISEIIISGNVSTNSSVINREFPSIPGEYLISDDFAEELQNLSSTDLFDNISVSIINEDKKHKKIKLHLSEKLPNVLRVGLRIDNENYTQLALDLRNENLFGSGSEAGLLVAGGSRSMSYLLEHKTNRIFNTYLTYKAQAFYKFNDVNQYADDYSEEVKRFSRSKIAEYRQRFYGGLIGIGAHLKKLGTLTAEAKYEVNEIENVSSFAIENEYKKNISSIKLRLQIDSQNKYPYPTKGMYVNTYYETSQRILGGDISFAKFRFDYVGYFTLGTKHTITPKIIFGFADETLPLSQQFSFGGQSNFLGYRDYEFRGRQILITSMQYRYHLPINLYFDTYIKIRYDLGSSWNNQEQIQFTDLKHGIGVSVSVDTPIGPADFSVGRSLYLKDTSPDRILSRGPFMFYFTIGFYY